MPHVRGRVLAAVLVSAFCLSCDRERTAPAVQPAPAETLFVEQAEAAGLDFVHENGMDGRFHEPETMGPGVALLDYDNDEDVDIFIVQGRVGARARLYRNDLAGGSLRFTDVTEGSGIMAAGYGMGVAAGDVNNDG